MTNNNLQKLINPNSINLSSKNIAIIYCEFNDEININLLNGCLEVLKKYQINNFKIFKVPGAYESIYMARHIIQEYENKKNNLDAIITIGCLIKGKSDHYDCVKDAVSQNLCNISWQFNIPIVFGILTVKNKKQAYQRAGMFKNSINLGVEYTIGLCEMLCNKEIKNNE